MELFTLKERTVVSPDGKWVVQEGKEDGRLLGPAGAQIPMSQAVALGLAKPKEDPKSPPVDEKGMRLDGPTLEEYVKAGYKPEHYPPEGYAEKDSPALQELRASQEAEKKSAAEKAEAEKDAAEKAAKKSEDKAGGKKAENKGGKKA